MKSKYEKLIKYEKIKPFKNICVVTGVLEECNIEIEYIPNKKVLEIASYREFFEQKFNMYIEEIAETVFKTISELIEPKYLRVSVFLEDSNLTPWSVTIEK